MDSFQSKSLVILQLINSAVTVVGACSVISTAHRVWRQQTQYVMFFCNYFSEKGDVSRFSSTDVALFCHNNCAATGMQQPLCSSVHTYSMIKLNRSFECILSWSVSMICLLCQSFPIQSLSSWLYQFSYYMFVKFKQIWSAFWSYLVCLAT